MPGSGNHVVDQFDEEQRRQEAKEIQCCRKCGASKTVDEPYCSETMDHCEGNCQDLVDSLNSAEVPEGTPFPLISKEAYLKCEFYRTREVCADCCEPIKEE